MKTIYLVWLFWIIGQAFHILTQAAALARSKSEARVHTLADVLRMRYLAFAARFFITTCAFMVLLQFPNLLPNLPSGALGPGVAGLLGWGADSILSFIPGLKTSLPPLDGNGPSTT